MKDKLNILLLEDIADDAGLVERMLNKEKIQFVSQRVDTREEFIDALAHFHPDVVLSDHGLPQFNSIEALRLCRESGMSGPFILVTGTVSEEFAVNCLKQGADDYVLKSNLSRLPSAILNALNQWESKNAKRKTEALLLLQNEELRQTNQKLIKAKSELDNFVYSVSHNLKSPLVSVLGLVNIARLEDKKHNMFSSHFSMIETSISKLNETLEDILDYSRNSRIETEIEKINAEALARTIFEKLKILKGAETIQYSMEVSGSKEFFSDRYRVGIILRNILTNAIQFQNFKRTPNIIKVQIFIDDKITLRIIDNGVGIEPEQQPLIFKMFHRGSEESNGAGLGLYIVHEAVDKLNGSVSVDSKPGSGTTFTIVLPNLP